MKNKGFTLIELVAIIVVLALIFLIALPFIVNSSKEKEKNDYNDMVKNLCLSGESYINANEESFGDFLSAGNIINVNVSDLISYGNVDAKVKNPKTDKSVKDDKLIFTVLEDNSLDCKYEEKK